jgi:hypothetical protein
MVWFKPKALYKDCPEGDSFESSPDDPLIAIVANLLSTAPTASSSSSSPRTANDTSTGALSLAPPKRVKPTHASSSKSNNKVKKERTPLSFFNKRKTKESTGAFPLLEQSNNQKVRIVQCIETKVMLYQKVSYRIVSYSFDVVIIPCSLFCLLFVGVHTHYTFSNSYDTPLHVQPKQIEKVLATIVTPVKIKASKTEVSEALEHKENIDPNDDATMPDNSPAETPPGKIPSSPIATKQLFQEAMVWTVDEDMPTSFPDIDWKCAAPTTLATAAEGAGLSVSFPDFAAFLRGMEKSTSVNLTDALNTSGFSSSFFASPEEDKIIVPEKLVEEDVSKQQQQQDKSAVECSEEESFADVSKQQDKSDVDLNNDGKPTEDWIEEETRADDSNKEDKPINVPIKEVKAADESVQEDEPAHESVQEGKPSDDSVQEDKPSDDSVQEDKPADESDQEGKPADESDQEGKPADDSSEEGKPADDSTEEEKSNVDENEHEKVVVAMNKLDALDQLVAAAKATEKALAAVELEISSDSKTPEKPKQTFVETPDFKMQAKSKNVPNLTPVSEAETNSYSESDEEGIGGRDLQSSLISFREESFSSQNDISESDALRELHSHYYRRNNGGTDLFSTDAVNEDDLVNEAYNSVNVSILSLEEIFQDDVDAEISALTPGLGITNAAAATEEVGPIYSLGTSFESTVSKVSSEVNRSMFGDWAAEVMSIEVSLEAGKFTLQKMDRPGGDTCVAQQGHFTTRTEYLPRLTLQDKPALVEGPQDELEADKEAADYFVKAEWNEFLPESIFTSDCQQGAVFSLTDFCNGKEWEIRC